MNQLVAIRNHAHNNTYKKHLKYDDIHTLQFLTTILMIPWFFTKIIFTRHSDHFWIPIPDNELVFSPCII